MWQGLPIAGAALVITAALTGACYAGMRRVRPRGPGSVREAIASLLASRAHGQKGGFVIFGGGCDLDYVQYSLDRNGLLLNWPTFQERGVERLPAYEEYLREQGFTWQPPAEDDANLRGQILSLRSGEYVVLDDGLYAQVGRNVEQIRCMTLDLMAAVFGVSDEKRITITFEPKS